MNEHKTSEISIKGQIKVDIATNLSQWVKYEKTECLDEKSHNHK